ncbi:MAG TPA: hypothetical protein VHP82_05825 [Gaiellaceae bacterium]|nr:hypothetical protein [Gaiellaceae bacterium]
MADLRIGERVTFRGRVCIVAGVSPMSIPARRVFLVDAETGERVEASVGRLDHL